MDRLQLWPSTSPQPVLWQWEHRTGFKDYDEANVQRIEEAYQLGKTHVRLKAGKMKDTPMELFFTDMIQHDPITGNVRNIRRVGPDSLLQASQRKVRTLFLHTETGRTRQMKFSQYRKMRKDLAESLDRSGTNEVELYHESGFCARVVRSGWFALASMTVILLNSLWLSIDTNFNNAATIWDADAVYQVAEHLFNAAFIAELAVRFGAYRRKRDCLKDGWFCFDAALVLLLVGETWVTLPLWLSRGPDTGEVGVGNLSILRIVRLLRLLRVGRVARLLRFAPEVLTMLKGITLALRSVFFTLTLLVVLLYVFGIIFKTQAEGYPGLKDRFSGVVESMWVLLLHGTFLDAVADIVPEMRKESGFLTFLFLVFIFLSSFTILNMLVGIICDVVTHVSKREKEQAAVAFLKSNLLEILEVHDKNDDRHIRKDEFDLLMRNPEMHLILTTFGVDAEDLISLKDVLFENSETLVEDLCSADESSTMAMTQSVETTVMSKTSTALGECKISFGEFLTVVLRLRGDNRARVRDVVDLREFVRRRLDRLELQLPPEQRAPEEAAGPRLAARAGSQGACCGRAPERPPGAAEAALQQFAELAREVREMSGQLARLEAREAQGA